MPCVGSGISTRRRPPIARSCREWQRLGQRGAVANLLEAFAFIAVQRGEPERASVLLGAAEQLRLAAAASMLAPEQLEYERWIANARAMLDTAAFDQAWGRGAAMTSEEAVTFAVSG